MPAGQPSGPLSCAAVLCGWIAAAAGLQDGLLCSCSPPLVHLPIPGARPGYQPAQRCCCWHAAAPALQLILGTSTPLPVIASLVPIMAGVAMASAAELSFNWTGFLTAMASNLTFGFRAVWSKK